jgi:hypothetical protein
MIASLYHYYLPYLPTVTGALCHLNQIHLNQEEQGFSMLGS